MGVLWAHTSAVECIVLTYHTTLKWKMMQHCNVPSQRLEPLAVYIIWLVTMETSAT